MTPRESPVVAALVLTALAANENPSLLERAEELARVDPRSVIEYLARVAAMFAEMSARVTSQRVDDMLDDLLLRAERVSAHAV